MRSRCVYLYSPILQGIQIMLHFQNRFTTILVALVALSSVGLTQSLAQAGASSALAKETLELLVSKFSREAAAEGTENLLKRVTQAISQHGDDAAVVIRKVGPRALQIIDDAGAHAGDAIRLMQRHGDDALKVVSNPTRMRCYLTYGDEAGDALIRHGDICLPVIEAQGKHAAAALASLSTQNARRMAMMHLDGHFAKTGRGQELLAVVARYGDSAMEFVWKHKVTLAGSAALAAFLSDPQKFLSPSFENAGFPPLPGNEGTGFIATTTRYLLWAIGIAVAIAALPLVMMLVRWLRFGFKMA
jgi:hypothetical protein